MRRLRSFVVAAAALTAALGTVPTATATPTASARPAAFPCTSGYFCIYSDWNGGGTRCQWSQSSKANTADDCSFIQRGQNVRSVWNNTRHRVQYYTQTNYHARVGSTPSGAGGNLQGNYQIRSFKPQ
ncbi:Peptidase inhibitor family I36 [Streptomyces sp. 2224.1]|uniref:peptidase inhibitor family I36 protein n=1 Tax=unclassified Streptomyces TaxID=2593676 RepID=UPI00087E56C4|nr:MULTISPECIES: peptidase inhibitor family I36 protein [unclassified Streptomyces]PBC86975.1 peptidase inhibitor family I36 [Streptomyces sp. 2321.6]SDQ65901.1 Peptidase inhibitor family I36 [Streptomyces sp. KS_16]SED33635.1 Peptidase inhibitor family I36 [Streptomyces sp. 2112.3]SED76262.1 Peptidase inhibitor family I36 [Streptomyces sp. 2224.1]SEE15384.1 Peptidase inhibitor family I36 [Streptomyces sp. 2133.1]